MRIQSNNIYLVYYVFNLARDLIDKNMGNVYKIIVHLSVLYSSNKIFICQAKIYALAFAGVVW